jgi:purine-binding chemotaxis protein CheW
MANNSEETKQYVIFKLGKESYGIDIRKVTTIEKEEQYFITRVPKTALFVKGVINLRGEIIPVINLRQKFNMDQIGTSEDTRIIIVKIDEVSLGLIVDLVEEVVYISNDVIENVGNITKDASANYIQGVGKLEDRIITLLNLNALIEV